MALKTVPISWPGSWKPVMLIAFGCVPATLLACLALIVLAYGVATLYQGLAGTGMPFTIALSGFAMAVWGGSAVASAVFLWIATIAFIRERGINTLTRAFLVAGILNGLSAAAITWGVALILALPASVVAGYLFVKSRQPRPHGDLAPIV